MGRHLLAYASPSSPMTARNVPISSRCPIHAVRRRSRSKTSTISAQAPGDLPPEDVSALRVERFAEIQGCEKRGGYAPAPILKKETATELLARFGAKSIDRL